MNKLTAIYDFLIECGIDDAEIYSDRIESYINVGNVKRRKERMQFWLPDDPDGVYVYIGTKMGKWYSASQKSPYLNSRWRYYDIENQIRFPTLDTMKDFIRSVV